MNVKLKKK